MMFHNDDEARTALFHSIEQVRAEAGWDEGRLSEELYPLIVSWKGTEHYYRPDDALVSRINDYRRWCETGEGEDPGRLMEEIAYLAFRSIRGWNSAKSFQSYGPQHDLVISGNDPSWTLIMKYLHLSTTGRTILIEAKNQDTAISDAQFSRLCGIMQNKYESICHLGVFLSRTPASGFPLPGDDQSRQRTLRDARATQALFHARTAKFVVVLDHEDVLLLTQEGALLKLLEGKIRDVEDLAGLVYEYREDGKETDLPPHLAKYG